VELYKYLITITIHRVWSGGLELQSLDCNPLDLAHHWIDLCVIVCCLLLFIRKTANTWAIDSLLMDIWDEVGPQNSGKHRVRWCWRT